MAGPNNKPTHHCQKTPAAIEVGPCMSIPAATGTLTGMNADMRPGQNMGSPVGAWMIASTLALASQSISSVMAGSRLPSYTTTKQTKHVTKVCILFVSFVAAAAFDACCIHKKKVNPPQNL